MCYAPCMPKDYHQYCPMAMSLERIGERWTLLIVRDLLWGPMRYSDLERSLDGIGTNLLASRLKDLQAAGIVEKHDLPPPAASTVYALTDLGRELQPLLQELARWGMNFLHEASLDEINFAEVFATRAPLAITRTPPTEEWYEFVMDGRTAAIHAGPDIFSVIEGRTADIPADAEGLQGSIPPPQTPDARIIATPAHFMGIMESGRTIADAVEAGDIVVEGDMAAAERAVGLFRMPGTEPVSAVDTLAGAEL